MVSNASEDLPEPLRPVSTISCSRGISTSTFFRLFSLAPLMPMVSLISPLPYPYACTARAERSLRATLPPLVALTAPQPSPQAEREQETISSPECRGGWEGLGLFIQLTAMLWLQQCSGLA